jgi:hypothetical protein
MQTNKCMVEPTFFVKMLRHFLFGFNESSILRWDNTMQNEFIAAIHKHNF